jgi:hypothetical protein
MIKVDVKIKVDKYLETDGYIYIYVYIYMRTTTKDGAYFLICVYIHTSWACVLGPHPLESEKTHSINKYRFAK